MPARFDDAMPAARSRARTAGRLRSLSARAGALRAFAVARSGPALRAGRGRHSGSRRLEGAARRGDRCAAGHPPRTAHSVQHQAVGPGPRPYDDAGRTSRRKNRAARDAQLGGSLWRVLPAFGLRGGGASTARGDPRYRWRRCRDGGALRDAAERGTFFVLAPDSRHSPDGQYTWQVGDHPGDATADLEHVGHCVDELKAMAGVQIDLTRVLIVGHSGGASEAPYVASNREPFTAFAVLHGGVFAAGLGPRHVRGWFSTGDADALTLGLPDINTNTILRLILGVPTWSAGPGATRTVNTASIAAADFGKLAAKVDSLVGDPPGTRTVQPL